MLSNEIKRLKMKKIKFENLEKKILKLDTYRRITQYETTITVSISSLLHPPWSLLICILIFHMCKKIANFWQKSF